jgi:acyl-coenzyme A thioesterase PaaI-like protein
MEERRVVNKQNNSARCLVCGLENTLGLFTRFYETETGEVVALATGRDEHQGYPGRMHGGIITALLDETIGRGIMINNPDAWGVTAELNVRYKKPVPLEEEIKIVGRIEEDRGKVFTGSGEIVLQDGTVAATASGKYIKQHISSIVTDSQEFQEDQWFLEERRDDPEYL